MADNEKDVPIREQEDGSILAKVEFPEEIGDDEVKKGKKADKDDDHDDEDHEEHEDEDAEDDENAENQEATGTARELRGESLEKSRRQEKWPAESDSRGPGQGPHVSQRVPRWPACLHEDSSRIR